MAEHTDPMENAPQHAASDPETADDATAAETVPGADDTAAKKARREAANLRQRLKDAEARIETMATQLAAHQGPRDPLRASALDQAAAARSRPRRRSAQPQSQARLGRPVRLTPHRTTPSAACAGPSHSRPWWPPFVLAPAARTRP